jgi:Flp pilus assembly protein TadG
MSCKRGRAPSGGRDHGAAAVEFALVFPLLLVLTFGIVNFGYLFGQKLALNQAVREGARMAVVANSNGGTNGSAVDSLGEITAIVQDAVGGLVEKNDVDVAVLNQSGATANLGCKSSGMDVGDQLVVSAEYDTGMLVPLPIPLLEAFTLTTEAVYRCEWQ